MCTNEVEDTNGTNEVEDTNGRNQIFSHRQSFILTNARKQRFLSHGRVLHWRSAKRRVQGGASEVAPPPQGWYYNVVQPAELSRSPAVMAGYLLYFRKHQQRETSSSRGCKCSSSSSTRVVLQGCSASRAVQTSCSDGRLFTYVRKHQQREVYDSNVEFEGV